MTPTVEEQFIVLTTAGGTVIKLDHTTGAVAASAKLPQPTANVNAAVSNTNPYLYQPGFYSNLYVLSTEDLSCREVYYLGHYQGSISVPPAIWSGHILVAVNVSDTCDLHILKPTEDGLNLQPVQRFRRITSGMVTSPMVRFGRWMLIASETGDLKMLELNISDSQNPFRIFAEEKFENPDGVRAHMLTEGSQLWIAGKGITRYRIQRSQGQFNRELIEEHGDYFLGPVQKFGDSLIHARRRAGSAMTSISAVDAISLKQIWRTDLGGPLAGPPRRVDDHLAVVSSQGDLFAIDQTSIDNSVADQAVKSSTISERLLFDETLQLSATEFVCVGPPGRPEILYVDAAKNASRVIKVQQPADKSVCRPVLFGNHLLVASEQGPVVRVDPRSGKIIGTPFLPAVSPEERIQWQPPVGISETKLVIGGNQTFYLLDAAPSESLQKRAEAVVDSNIRSPLVAIGNMVYAVVGSNLVALNVDDKIQPAAQVPLASDYVSGPWIVNDLILLVGGDDQLVCFDKQLAQKWTLSSEGQTLAGAPSAGEHGIAVCFTNGRLIHVDPQNGQVVSEFELKQPIAHAPLIENETMYFSGSDGTVHIATLEQQVRK
jgi:outer membrane protein assembly factor BamB